MVRLEAVGVVFIGMGWCNGPGARVWRGVKPPAHLVPSKSCKNPVLGRFGGRKKVRILTIPLCWGPPGCLPRHFIGLRHFCKTLKKCPSGRILYFSGKKVGRKWPFCPRAPMSTGAGPGPARGRPEPGSLTVCARISAQYGHRRRWGSARGDAGNGSDRHGIGALWH